MRDARFNRTICSAAATFAALLLCIAPVRADLAAFVYGQITEPIQEAVFTADFAAMTAHRYIGAAELNFARLIDRRDSITEYDLSDDLFGTAVYPNPPQVDMGGLETGWVSATIPSSFYSALAFGSVGLRAVFTDTDDAMFAVDFLSLTITTSSRTIVSYYGWPLGNPNNGFGIGLADGGDLPGVLPDAIPVNSTGTGFDETISGMSIDAVPEPATLGLCLVAGMLLPRRR